MATEGDEWLALREEVPLRDGLLIFWLGNVGRRLLGTQILTLLKKMKPKK